MSLAATILQRIAGPTGLQRAQRRISKMSSNDLVDWLDVGIMGVGRSFAEWRSGGRNEAVDSLGEARMNAATVLLALDELDRRRTAGTL